MDLRGHLQAIYDSHGRLTPALVVDEARNPEHPLHNRFEWDDAVASEAWRRAQAHELIRLARCVYKKADRASAEKSVRAFHAVRSDDGHVYEPAEKVVSDPFLARLVLADMRRDWTVLKRRYDEFEEFWTMLREEIPDAA